MSLDSHAVQNSDLQTYCFLGQVDDILGEESDHECEEKGKVEKLEQEKEAEEKPQNCRQRAGSVDYQDLGTLVKDTLLSSSSLSESISRYCTCSGHKGMRDFVTFPLFSIQQQDQQPLQCNWLY